MCRLKIKSRITISKEMLTLRAYIDLAKRFVTLRFPGPQFENRRYRVSFFANVGAVIPTEISLFVIASFVSSAAICD
jgi:hypothetical protein